jgi:hypothetical protein
MPRVGRGAEALMALRNGTTDCTDERMITLRWLGEVGEGWGREGEARR